jgi:hypothetical protein
MAVDAISSIFPVKPQTGGGFVDSAVSTPQVAPAVKAAVIKAPAAVATAAATPAPFSADIPTTLDATTGAKAFSEPNVLPAMAETTEPKIFQMADGRFYNPSTGLSGTTREEVLGVKAPGVTGEVAPKAESATTPAPASDDITATIQSLFPESDTLVKQYDDLRKSSGLVDLETQQDALNKEIADMNAVIENVEEEVRAQAAGLADQPAQCPAVCADRLHHR